MSVDQVPGPCADCGSTEPCAAFDGRPLCYDHWHAARERTPPYWVRRDVSPEHDAEYGHMYFGSGGGRFPPSVLTEAEAREEAARLNERSSSGERWVPVMAPHWASGERRAHPGYMNLRRQMLG